MEEQNIMEFKIIDSESAYRRMLEAPDAATREAIFSKELVEPFAGLVQIFGGGHGLKAFENWRMWPEQFAPEHHQRMTRILDTLAAADAWNKAVEALNEGWEAFAAYHHEIPTKAITFALLLADMRGMPGQRGYTGFGGIPGWIMTVYDEPDEDNLARIKAVTVHELHHNLLGAARPMDFMNSTTVGDYMVMEGLAESFSAELYGEDLIGPWVTEFDMSHMERTKAIFRDGMTRTGFNTIRGYIFGGEIAEAGGFEKVDVPMLAGYALGYRTVQAYLKKTGKSVVEATFVPASEIIAQSGYFG
jgi:uncharacterized protein YjaZ